MRRLILLTILLLLLTGLLFPITLSAQLVCPPGHIQTTLQQEGLPNLFRLGLRYGVSWTRIILPSGAHPVPERVFPNTILCVPIGGSVTVVNVPPAVPPVNSGLPPIQIIPIAPAAPAAGVDANSRLSSEQAYCAGVPVHGIPDLGSCQLEARAIFSGQLPIVLSGVSCKPGATGNMPDGTPIRCNIFGNAYLSTERVLPTAVPTSTPLPPAPTATATP